MTEVAAVSTRADAEARRDRIKAGMATLWDDIKAAWRERDWIALGYASWDDMCEAEYRLLVALPRSERPEVVADLRAEGMSTRAIAAATGVSHPTVMSDLRSGGKDLPPEPVRGTDGKTYAPTHPIRAKVEVIEEPQRTVTVNVPTVTEEPQVEQVEVLTAEEWAQRQGVQLVADEPDPDDLLPEQSKFERAFWRHLRSGQELVTDLEYPHHFNEPMSRMLLDLIESLNQKRDAIASRGLRVVNGGKQ